ncbi:MAG: class I SAM-dependent methyltransferase [Chloroflexi bacterium]|nr:MAG: class I SAM-dependent methyltransferase [Chloroflexota bacterium]
MNIDFHSPENRYTYASRAAHPDWAAAIRSVLDPVDIQVADVGCGGGIYSAAWLDIGAASVVGVDFSEEMVRAATERNGGPPNISFRQGDATATGLPSESRDIVFERALIHHLTDYTACFEEAHRLLRPGGHYVIQDRTPEDITIAGSPDHIRGYFFECFPKLLDTELGRRPTTPSVEHALRAAGFVPTQTTTVWETRTTYAGIEELSQDLLGRVGRSILHYLTDSELAELVAFIAQRLPAHEPIVERDRWTIWCADKSH